MISRGYTNQIFIFKIVMIGEREMDYLIVTLLHILFQRLRIGYSGYKYDSTISAFFYNGLTFFIVASSKDSDRRFIYKSSKIEILIGRLVNFLYYQPSLDWRKVFRSFGNKYYIGSSHISFAFPQIAIRHHMISDN